MHIIMADSPCCMGFPGGSAVKNPSAIQGTEEMLVQSLGWEDSPEVGHGNRLQYSCLEKPMDRGAWWATVHGVAESQTTVVNEHVPCMTESNTTL